MSYKDILVFLDSTADTPARLHLAVSMAQKHSARLLGVDVSMTTAPRDRPFGEANQNQVLDLFSAQTKRYGIESEFRMVDRSTPVWKDLFAHFVDLVIAPQKTRESRKLIHPAVPEDVLLSSGVPMLVLPPAWEQQPLGRSVVIAWTPNREATRAVHDAIPLLRHAERVTLFEFAPPADRVDSAPRLITDHLRRHGVDCEIYTWPYDPKISPVDTMFACLDRQEADLIVSGAYGRSRAFEGLFGGASRDLLHNPAMPVLMSH